MQRYSSIDEIHDNLLHFSKMMMFFIRRKRKEFVTGDFRPLKT